MSQSSHKRQLRPTASLPTTAEVQAEKHGIDAATAAALQSIGRKVRSGVQLGQNQHRQSQSLGPTQSLPTHTTPNQPSSSSSSSSTIFETAADTIQTAHQIISKESWRQREVQPFANNSTAVDTLSLSPRGSKTSLQMESRERERKLRFTSGGEWGMEAEEAGGMDWEPSPVKSRSSTSGGGYVLGQAKKRNRTAREGLDGEDDGSDTEVDDDDDDDDDPEVNGGVPGLRRDLGSGSASASVSGSTLNDFPPVFTTPALTHPELFQPAPRQPFTTKTTTSGPAAVNDALSMKHPALTRVTKNLPVGGKRGFGKTMSAPVGSLGHGFGGRWSAGSGTDVEMEDGFDIKTWASKEEF